MNMRLLTLCLLASLAAGCHSMSPCQKSAARPHVKLGDEVLFEKHLDLIRGKHIGFITNPTGLDSKLDSVIDKFRSTPDVHLVALYGR
jgi:uncharacterized protein YbbC (DUF1343 family)